MLARRPPRTLREAYRDVDRRRAIPYGFAREGKIIVQMPPAEIRIVRLIFEAADLAVKDIAGALNSKELTRRNGKPWTARQVSAILARRPLYYDGMIWYGEASGRNPRLAVLGNESDDAEKEREPDEKSKTAPL